MNDTSSKGNLLLVDDDTFLVELYRSKFTREGYAVRACTAAKDALAILRGGFVPDVILFDIEMPEQDGFSFLQALLAEHLAPNSRIIALTNDASDADKIKAGQLGASGYIVKATMTPGEVATIVADVIAQQSQA